MSSINDIMKCSLTLLFPSKDTSVRFKDFIATASSLLSHLDAPVVLSRYGDPVKICSVLLRTLSSLNIDIPFPPESLVSCCGPAVVSVLHSLCSLVLAREGYRPGAPAIVPDAAVDDEIEEDIVTEEEERPSERVLTDDSFLPPAPGPPRRAKTRRVDSGEWMEEVERNSHKLEKIEEIKSINLNIQNTRISELFHIIIQKNKSVCEVSLHPLLIRSGHSSGGNSKLKIFK